MSEGHEAHQSCGNRHNPQPLLRPQSIEPTCATFKRQVQQTCASHARRYKMGLKARVLCKRSSVPSCGGHGVTKLSLATPRGSVAYTHRLSTLYFDVLGVCHSRSKRTSARTEFAEVSSTSALTACRRSVLPVCQQLVGHRPVCP